MRLIDLTGERFGRLVVLRRDKSKSDRVFWVCKCDCGKTVSVMGTNLKRGNTKSCGCLNIDRIKERKTTHGGRRTRLYSIWHNMRRRCNDPK